jgi:16S rRNA (cytidine1402-2'-O)-methyltransferase
MLSITATPIGNLGDISARAIEALRAADVIACEDTRRTRNLLTHFEIPRPSRMISYREGMEHKAGEQVVRALDNGLEVVLCSDGGMPCISDPGYRLIGRIIEAGHEFTVIPGASAAQAALVLSGLSTSSYTFKGFPPRKRGAHTRFFEEEKDMAHTIVIFESPHRVSKCLDIALDALGDRMAAVCIELTKKFERVSRGYLSDLCSEYEDRKVKGEVTIVIAGNNPKFHRDQADTPSSS